MAQVVSPKFLRNNFNILIKAKCEILYNGTENSRATGRTHGFTGAPVRPYLSFLPPFILSSSLQKAPTPTTSPRL